MKAGRDIVFVANSSDDEVSTTVSIRGALELEVWDPHTGNTEPAAASISTTDAGPRTEVVLRLPPVRSSVLLGSALT